jgi:hypothetical protein
MPSFASPEALAAALLRGPLTPARVRKAQRHAARDPRLDWARTLAALPEAARVQVEAAAVPVSFRG